MRNSRGRCDTPACFWLVRESVASSHWDHCGRGRAPPPPHHSRALPPACGLCFLRALPPPYPTPFLKFTFFQGRERNKEESFPGRGSEPTKHVPNNGCKKTLVQ